MITTSANYKTAIKAISREIRAYLKFNGSTIYRGVDGLVSINWNAQLFDKERFCVNCANAAYIEAEMYGEPIQNLETAYVEAFIGVVLEYKASKPSGSIEDDTADVEYVKIGRFDVAEVVRKNGKVMITAYDRMAKLSENYATTVTPTADGYSKSAIVTDIKNQCGLTWTQSFSGYVPEIINSTMRDQLCWLYGSTTSTGQSLMLSRDGTTVISKVIVGQTALNYTIDEATTYLDGLNDQPTFTITSYTANAGENTYSYGSGAGVECYNPYITSTIASNTYNFIKNFSYTPMTLEFRGDPAIELGDILTVTSGNNSYSVVVMKMATVFNGGLKTTIYCYGNTEEWDAISNSPTGARIIQTENMVRIEASRASEAEGQLQSSIEANAEAITLRATKEEAQGYASDAESAAKSYADSQISVSASGILSTVSQTYQTQANAAVMQTQIDQNAHDITLKVSESDVTGNYVIGKINLNSTTATIAAEHINLQGAVSISSFNNATQAALLTGTAVKNQYYISTSSSSATGGTWADTTAAWSSGKYVWTRVVTTKTYADGTSTTTNGTAVYDANLTTSLSTGASAASTANSAASAASAAQNTANTAIANTPVINLLPSVYQYEYQYGKTWTYGGITWTVNADGSITITGTCTSSHNYELASAYLTSTVPGIRVEAGKKYTFSHGATGSGYSTTFGYQITQYKADGTSNGNAAVGDDGRTLTMESTTVYVRVRLNVVSGYVCPTDGLTLYPMMVQGDAVKPYVSTHNGSGAINRQEQLIYRSAASGTTTMSGTTTWVTDVTGGQNKWTAVRPQYSQTYPVLFIATQRQTMGGTVTCTTPKIDETTTVIDGGHIITGTIDANKITANTTFTQKLYAQDFNISGGSVNITTSSSTNDAIVLTYSVASATRTINLNAYTGVSVGYTDSSYSNVAELSHNGLSLKYNSGTYSDYYSNLTTDYIIIGNKSDRRLYATYNAIKFEKDPSNTGTVNGSIALQSYTSGGTLTFGTGDGGTLAINAYTGNMGMSMAYGSGESCTMSPSGGLVFKNSSNAVTATYGASDSSITGQYKSTKSPGAVSIAPGVAAFLSQTGANQTNIFMAHNSSTNNGIALGVGSGGVNRGILDYKAGADNGWMIYFDGTNIYLNKPTNAVSTFRIANSAQYPGILIRSSDGKGGAYSQIYSDGASVNSIYQTRNICFRNYSYNASTGAALSYHETFSLPVVTTGRTAHGYYNILTSKVTGTLTESDPTTTTALASGTYKSCGSVSLAAGTWLVMVEAQFAANATGTRYLIPSYTADSSSTAVHWSAEAIMPAVTASGYATAVKSTFVAHPTATSTVYFNCWQNSGSSLNVKIRYQILRIL